MLTAQLNCKEMNVNNLASDQYCAAQLHACQLLSTTGMSMAALC